MGHWWFYGHIMGRWGTSVGHRWKKSGIGYRYWSIWSIPISCWVTPNVSELGTGRLDPDLEEQNGKVNGGERNYFWLPCPMAIGFISGCHFYVRSLRISTLHPTSRWNWSTMVHSKAPKVKLSVDSFLFLPACSGTLVLRLSVGQTGHIGDRSTWNAALRHLEQLCYPTRPV